MGQILIRNVNDDVIEAFKERARSNGKSLEQEIRDLLHSQGQPTLTSAEKVAISREIRARTKGIVPHLTAKERREGLE